MTDRLILASVSPRRKEILSYFPGIEIEQVASGFNEASVPYLGDPDDYVLAMARGKATSLVPNYPTLPILAADTVVYRKGRIYEKPTSEQEAFELLSALAGKTHYVYTGVAVCHGPQVWSQTAITEVTLTALSEQQVKRYQEAIEPCDKAGGYMVQRAGSLIIEKMSGCFYNAMGLPIGVVRALLLEAGIDLWDHLA